MLADFYIPKLSNDKKIGVQTNHLEICGTVDPSKNGVVTFLI